MTTSPLRRALRERLTAAMRARDRGAVSALRTTLAALENAEAVPVPGAGAVTAASEHVAAAAVGLGAGETERRVLDREEERRVVAAEVTALRESAAHRRAAGDPASAEEAEAGARLVAEVAASTG